ncbi:hypothetical protein PVK06_024163 [Gossypium arboreum]|uniref:Intersectin-1-like n=1 Tax=Gossypium arboreum TaxID=29729 RepID=A0ABR0PDM5_GOSAR|nr:hypothetical protein PVK06_024163 [Gossypium arboreum]
MDKRLEKLEQMQKDMQEQMQSQMQEQLAKIQQEMEEQMMESQREMMIQLSQLLVGRMDKGKIPMENNKDPQYPPEERCKWLEEKVQAMEGIDRHHGIDAKDLSLVPDLVLPYKFKMPEFKKYNGTSCPEAHITMFYRRMTWYVNNDQLLIHCFQDSSVGLAAKWYNQLSRNRISS